MSKYFKRPNKRERRKRTRRKRNILRIISIVLFMCHSPIHIIHYDFYDYEATWSQCKERKGREKKTFSSSHDYCKSRQTFLLSLLARCCFWFPNSTGKIQSKYEFINVLFRNLLRWILCLQRKIWEKCRGNLKISSMNVRGMFSYKFSIQSWSRLNRIPNENQLCC